MSRKLVVTLVLILFLLPFVSWYYLNSGLTWRKEAQAIMNGTVVFPSGAWKDSRDVLFSSELLDEHVTLVSKLTCDNMTEQSDILSKIYDQFKETKKANYILLTECEQSINTGSDSLKVNWFVFNCLDSINQCNTFFPNWPAGKSFALVDRDNLIRSYYSATTKEEKRLLLEHMALLLPRERSDKVELRRDTTK